MQIIRDEILVCLKSRLHMNTRVSSLAGFSYKKFIEHYPQALLDKKILETSHDCMDAVRERISGQYDAMSVATKLVSSQETVYLPSDFEKLKATLTKLQNSYVD